MWQIHPENTYHDNPHRPGNRSHDDDRSRYEDMYQSDQRNNSSHDDNRRDDNRRNENDTDDYSRDDCRCNVLIEKMTNKSIIGVIVEMIMIKLIYPNVIMITLNLTEEVIIRTTEDPIITADRAIIGNQIANSTKIESQKDVNSSNMILGREIIQILAMLDDLNMKLKNQEAHQF